MDAKEYLESLRLLDARTEQRLKQLDDIENRRSYIKTLNEQYAVSQVNGDMLSDLAAKVSDEILHFEKQRSEIIGRIQSLNDHKFIQVLYKRYVEYKSFEQIAAELGYARSHTLALHRNALEALQAVIPSG